MLPGFLDVQITGFRCADDKVVILTCYFSKRLSFLTKLLNLISLHYAFNHISH